MADTFVIQPAPFFINDEQGSASVAITVPGIYELGTGTGSAFTLSAAPYVGALVAITQMGSATAGKSVTTNATTVTVNVQGDRTITFDAEGDSVILMGVSTTRWQVLCQSGCAFS